jgi:hypothetical protein
MTISSTDSPDLIKPLCIKRWSMFLLVASLLATFVAWGVTEIPALTVEPKPVGNVGMGPENFGITQRLQREAELPTVARVYGVLGGVTGLLLGVAAGLAGGSTVKAVRAGLIGLVLGLLAGAATAYAVVPLYHRFKESVGNDIVASLGLHGTIWAPVGLVAGIAAAMALGGDSRRSSRLIVFGFFGAIVGATVYEVAAALIFPTAETGEPIAKVNLARLLAMASLPIFTALALIMAIGERRKKNPPVAA